LVLPSEHSSFVVQLSAANHAAYDRLDICQGRGVPHCLSDLVTRHHPSMREAVYPGGFAVEDPQAVCSKLRCATVAKCSEAGKTGDLRGVPAQEGQDDTCRIRIELLCIGRRVSCDGSRSTSRLPLRSRQLAVQSEAQRNDPSLMVALIGRRKRHRVCGRTAQTVLSATRQDVASDIHDQRFRAVEEVAE
jgi:hypothetical protein